MVPGKRPVLSRLSRLVALLASVAQLAFVIAPLAEWRAGASTRAHVEASGTTAHYAHDETSCPACRGEHHAVRVQSPSAPATHLSVAPLRVRAVVIDLAAGLHAVAAPRPPPAEV